MNSVLIIFLGIVLLFVGIVFWVNAKGPNINPSDYCYSAEDCVPAQCCHPTSAVNKNYAPQYCDAADCSDVCIGPLECQVGRIDCLSNKCVIVPYENYQNNEKYCEQDSDCTTRPSCCNECYRDYVNIYHRVKKDLECPLDLCPQDCPPPSSFPKAVCRNNACVRDY